MNTVVERYLPLESRQKIYVILAFISLTLLFYGIWQIKPVIVEVDSPLGLASHLPPCYWIGLALLVLDSILAFLDRELKKDAIFLLLLITLGLFLYGIVVFAFANIRIADAYYPNAEVSNLLAAHHIDIANPSNIGTYYSWPAIHFINASILATTGVDIGFIKYMPLFWIFCFVFITYGIGKRLELAPNRCFLLSFLAISSWLFMFHYHPHTLGMILYLLLFMLLLSPRRTVAESLTVMLLFGVLVITHGFTALAVLPALVILSIYRKETRFIALFVVIFGAWYMYQASAAMGQGVQQWWAAPLRTISRQVEVEAAGWVSAPARAVSRYSQLSYLALYAALTMGSVIMLLRRRIAEKHRKWVISSFCWAAGAALLTFSFYGELARIYLFCIIPAACIAVLSFYGRKLITILMVALLCLLPALCLTASYGVEAAWGYILTTELKGAEFFALRVKPQPPDDYFYNYCNAKLMLYYNVDLLPLQVWQSGNLPPWPEVDFSALDRSHYVIIGRQGTNAAIFGLGEDRYAVWPQTEAGNMANLLYNNGYYQIYENHLAK